MMDDEKKLYEYLLHTTRYFFGDRNPTKQEVLSYLTLNLDFLLDMQNAYPALKDSLDRDDFAQRLFTQYWQEQSVRQNIGAYLTSSDDNTPWLPNREETLDWEYWSRYKKYLEVQQGWSKEVTSTIGTDSYEILSLTADPMSDEPFNKRGLVVGNIQSGKTANYLGLICRAADVGYRYIVVLASTTNDLREQTQTRIEEGFIGIDYSPFLTGKKDSPDYVGVGKFETDKFRHPNPGTTRLDDFSKTKMKALVQVRHQNTSEPWVFVIKKNPHSLRNLIEWLKSGNIDSQEDQLFLIDDEADYASINTLASKDRITRINEKIRELLSLFPKSVYVGYTATPYANILIDQDAMDDEIGADVFPRNFIYTLNAADSYFGASKVLEDIEPDDDQIVSKPKYIRFISEDEKEMIPPSAKELDTPVLPLSMIDAVRTFVLAGTVRLMRDGEETHATMLVNVSPYNRPQQQIKQLLDTFVLERLKPALRNYGYKASDFALNNSFEIREIKRCWDYEFEGNLEFSWEDVFPRIQPLFVKELKTVEVNSKSKGGLDYKSDPQRVIAVGGYRLSRGLTLEGLLVSYYSRNTRAYDSLLQMSRWFGHRVGYEDLCRIWMTAESAGWCRFVSDATDELMYDLVRMQQQNKTPLEFGQKVRAHPGTLMVTASAKMGAGVLQGDVSLNGKLVEATVLDRDAAALRANYDAARMLQSKLEAGGYKNEIWSGNVNHSGGYGILFRGVPRVLVEEFISHFKPHPAAMHAQPDQILEQIGYCTDEGLVEWTVLFAATNPDASVPKDLPAVTFECMGRQFRRQRRSPGNRTDDNAIYIGNRFKVSTKQIDSVGMDMLSQKEAIDECETARESYKVSYDYFFRLHRKVPLLVIHYLDMRFLNEAEYRNACAGLTKEGKTARNGKLVKQHWKSCKDHIDATSWSISFPPLKKDRHVRYVFNKVMLDQMGIADDFGDEDEAEQLDS